MKLYTQFKDKLKKINNNSKKEKISVFIIRSIICSSLALGIYQVVNSLSLLQLNSWLIPFYFIWVVCLLEMSYDYVPKILKKTSTYKKKDIKIIYRR